MPFGNLNSFNTEDELNAPAGIESDWADDKSILGMHELLKLA